MDDGDDFLLDLLSYTCPLTGKLRIAGGCVETHAGRLEFLSSYSALLFELFVDDMLKTQCVNIVSVDVIMLCVQDLRLSKQDTPTSNSEIDESDMEYFNRQGQQHEHPQCPPTKRVKSQAISVAP